MGASQQIHPVILAGGSGVRLWPLSRPSRPKPFLFLTGEHTFLQMTVSRVADPRRFAPPLVVCGSAHRFLVAEQLQQLTDALPQIVLEPVARNTAPAACTAALLVADKDPDGLLVLLPSDHYIDDAEGFLLAVDQAVQAAANGWITTFGARPERPETGYGYIQRGEKLANCDGARRVIRFVEKPDLSTAQRYLADGSFSWNSGMFLMPARLLLNEMERFEPAILSACKAALNKATSDHDFLRLDEAAFTNQPSLSFDYAIMERTDRSAVVPIDIGWSDVGSWDALYQIASKDENGNALHGDVVAVDNRNTYLHSQGVPIAALGLDNIVVIATGDALLVCPRSRAQDLSLIIDQLNADPRYASLTTTDTTAALTTPIERAQRP